MDMYDQRDYAEEAANRAHMESEGMEEQEEEQKFSPGDRVHYVRPKVMATVLEVMVSGTLRLRWDSGHESLTSPDVMEKVSPSDDTD